ARSGLTDDLTHARYHQLNLAPQAPQRCLLGGARRVLGPIEDFLGKALGLPDHPARGRKKIGIGLCNFALPCSPLARAARPISITRCFTLRLRSRSLHPTSPVILVIFFMTRVSTRTPSPNRELSVG